MTENIILASGSEIRATLLRNAGVSFTTAIAHIDETAIRASLKLADAPPRDVADALAEMKARKIAQKNPTSLVIGADQVLSFQNEIIAKPESQEEAISQIKSMRSKQHQLLSAAVIYMDDQPIWRHVGVVRLFMRDVSDGYIHDYVERHWHSIQHSVGGYKLEEEGVRLFSRIDGDYFNVLGLPLLEILNFLSIRGTLPS
jgi:septum formation protein